MVVLYLSIVVNVGLVVSLNGLAAVAVFVSRGVIFFSDVAVIIGVVFSIGMTVSTDVIVLFFVVGISVTLMGILRGIVAAVSVVLNIGVSLSNFVERVMAIGMLGIEVVMVAAMVTGVVEVSGTSVVEV